MNVHMSSSVYMGTTLPLLALIGLLGGKDGLLGLVLFICFNSRAHYVSLADLEFPM